MWKKKTLCVEIVVVSCDDRKLMSSTIGIIANKL